MQPLHVLILAAGEGKRFRSSRPKLLHHCAGLPLITHVVRAACALEEAAVTVVVGSDATALRDALRDEKVRFAIQDAPRGTADAVAAGIASLDAAEGRLLVINGDCPGVRPATLRLLVDGAGDAAAAALVVRGADPSGYGRIVRDDQGRFAGIVEELDAGAGAGDSIEVNGGVYCFDLAATHAALRTVGTDNAGSERYLTRVFDILAADGKLIRAVDHHDAEEVHGVNTRAELARAEALLRRRVADRLMDGGVTLRDPDRTYVDVDVQVGADSILHPGVTLEGDTTIGAGCEIHANVRIRDSRLGDGVTVLDGSTLEKSIVAAHANLGPYARLRPGSDIGEGAKVGNFVETKATRLGNGSKASHLSYLGDARIGDHVNVGAGTITCNYDGANKNQTIIDDGAFIGSNTALVAPVRIGKNAYVGAGSTITEDVPDNSLGLGRGRQVNKVGWADEQGSSATAARDDEKDSAGGQENAGAKGGHD